MRSIRTLSARLVITALLATAVLVPAAPASAHGRLPRGHYVCRNFDAFDGYSENGYVVRIRTKRRYSYLREGVVVGEPGRFRHPSDSKRIRFRGGYMKEQGWRGIHKRVSGDHVIQLQSKSDGTWYDVATCTR